MADIYLGFLGKNKATNHPKDFMRICKDLTIKLRQNGFNSDQIYFVYGQRSDNSGVCHLMYVDKPVATMKENNGIISIDRCFDLQIWPGENQTNLGLKATAAELYAATIRYFNHRYQQDYRTDVNRRITYQ